MAKLTQKQIRQNALQIIAQNPTGIRYTDLLNRIVTQDSETPPNTVTGAIWNLDALYPNDVTKPSKGLYVPATNSNVLASTPSANGQAPLPNNPSSFLPQIQEQQFYQPFADYLKGELSEVVVAESLGGAGLGKKGGTPDVVGVYKPLASDRVKFEMEIVSGEIKIDHQESVTVFGQAIAYRLFSTKVYDVMPNSISKEDE